jgi:hypothetical protein
MGLPLLLEEICRLVVAIYKSLKDMVVEIGAEAALLPEKEYINGIAVAVYVAGRWGQIKSESVLGYLEKPRNDKNLFHNHDKRKKPTKKGPLSYVL